MMQNGTSLEKLILREIKKILSEQEPIKLGTKVRNKNKIQHHGHPKKTYEVYTVVEVSKDIISIKDQYGSILRLNAGDFFKRLSDSVDPNHPEGHTKLRMSSVEEEEENKVDLNPNNNRIEDGKNTRSKEYYRNLRSRW